MKRLSITDASPTFAPSAYDIFIRINTNETIQCDVPAWNRVGEAAAEQVKPG